ncbi:hypothetical protein H1Z61_04555 [Bacillus aquiflavi]|uniref:Uncharacterized protein n=1 Tax=Bacillus aquiflavi TaxID=2672567 RepID=A0A6B3VYV1_9BACI|nr:hypothetical protein [Bacillus aquiflavi]MBA4536433.1 hypothetical protein [Bacillus aquiflavi]NEY80801.1 hypothetical protein [Bacillus aquiflavi]
MKQSINRLNKTQLQQQLIYFKSELTKFKKMVESYQEDYHYSQLKVLKRENEQLKNEAKQYQLQLREIEKETETRNNKQQTELEQNYHKIDFLEKVTVRQQKEIIQLQKENVQYQEELHEQNELDKKLQQQLKMLAAENEQLREQQTKFKQKNLQQKTYIDLLNCEISDKRLFEEKSAKRIYELEVQLWDDHHAYKELLEENERLHKRIDKEIILQHELHMKTKDLQQKMNLYKINEIAYEKQLNDLQNINATLSAEIARFNKERSHNELELSAKIKELRNELNTYNHSSTIHKDDEDEIKQLQQQINEIILQINKDEDELNKNISTINHVELQINQLMEEINTIKKLGSCNK